MARNENTVTIRDAQIIFRNFEGKADLYNVAGQRNFGVALDEKLALAMLEDNWPVKRFKPREEDLDEDPDAIGTPYIKVTLKYRDRQDNPVKPPTVGLVTSRGRTNLDEGNVKMLDLVEITKADLIIRPFAWEVGEKSGIAAYLKSLFVTIEEDELEAEYNQLDVQ